MTSQPGRTLPCYAQWVPQRQNWNLSFVQDLMIEAMWNWMSFVWPGAGKYLAIVNCKHLAIWVSLCTQSIHSIITHSCKYQHMKTMNFPDCCGCSWTSLGFPRNNKWWKCERMACTGQMAAWTLLMDNVCQLGEMILVWGKKITKNNKSHGLCHVLCAIEAAWIEFLCTIMVGCTFAANVMLSD